MTGLPRAGHSIYLAVKYTHISLFKRYHFSTFPFSAVKQEIRVEDATVAAGTPAATKPCEALSTAGPGSGPSGGEAGVGDSDLPGVLMTDVAGSTTGRSFYLFITFQAIPRAGHSIYLASTFTTLV
jgi:hypothetical protein